MIAPLLGAALGFILMLAVSWFFRNWRYRAVNNLFRKGQLISATLYSLGHGGNDAQKTMGLILAVLIAGGHLSAETKLSLSNPETLWVILSCHLAMGVGTMFGGWSIVKTMGMKITKLTPPSGFCAEAAGAITLFLSTYGGIPVSTTHTITGSIVGAGSVMTHFRGVKWGLAARIIWAWVLTIPAAGLMGAAFLYLCYWTLD